MATVRKENVNNKNERIYIGFIEWNYIYIYIYIYSCNEHPFKTNFSPKNIRSFILRDIFLSTLKLAILYYTQYILKYLFVAKISLIYIYIYIYMYRFQIDFFICYQDLPPTILKLFITSIVHTYWWQHRVIIDNYIKKKRIRLILTHMYNTAIYILQKLSLCLICAITKRGTSPL